MRKHLKTLVTVVLVVSLLLFSSIAIWAKENSDNDAETDTQQYELSNNETQKDTSEEQSSDEEKLSVYDKMLNTIDNFNSIEGDFTMKFMNDEFPSNVNYKVDLAANYAVENISGNDIDIQTITDEGETLLLNNAEKGLYRISNIEQEDIVSEMSVEDRTQVDEDNGEKVWYYRNDPTGFTYAKESTFPQERTFGYLYDFQKWDIIDEELFAERNCWRIEGELTGDYSEKLKIKSYTFLVDVETGCLLKYEGYNAEGNMTEYLTTNSIIVNEPIAVTYQNKDIPDGYTDWTAETIKMLDEILEKRK